MAGYIIGNVLEVTDPAGFEDYRSRVPPTVEKYGGRYIARGGKIETLEGNWRPERLVILEFPSFEQAQRWYDSEEYREPKEMRQRTASTNLVLVEGV